MHAARETKDFSGGPKRNFLYTAVQGRRKADVEGVDMEKGASIIGGYLGCQARSLL